MSKAYYIYTEEEAAEPFYAVLHETSWIMEALPIILSIKGEISFAVAASQAPYQVVHLGNGSFVVLIDRRAFYMLLGLCLRIQSLPPLAQVLDIAEIDCDKDYQGMLLADIVKNFTFHADPNLPYARNINCRIVYQAANTFIVGHEIAHISHGHLEFRASSDFLEFCKDESDRNLTLRTLEMDADSSATTSVIEVFERLIDHVIASGRLPAHTTPEAVRLSVRKQYVAGMFIALLHMDALSSNFAPVAYPISYARFLTTSGVAQIALALKEPDAASIPDLIRQRIVAVFERLSGDISTLGHPIASNVTMYDESQNPHYFYDELGIVAGEAHLMPLYSRWARIRPFLEKYQRGGRLAPAQATPF
ncbi:hypothetical protein [Mesorhizobium sp. LjNodule214]|uniref:hypothetical protein n=1 Tax=Mesorhizobium sp. LjNodule214 TaxID=3342252 RepID=UPI003ECDB9A5